MMMLQVGRRTSTTQVKIFFDSGQMTTGEKYKSRLYSSIVMSSSKGTMKKETRKRRGRGGCLTELLAVTPKIYKRNELNTPTNSPSPPPSLFLHGSHIIFT